MYSTAGLALAALNLGNQRMAMSIVPAMGRSHFLALFSVVNGLTLGVLPIVWGIALDSLGGWRHGWTHWEWNQFSALYVALVLVALAAQVWHTRLTEPRAMTTEQLFPRVARRDAGARPQPSAGAPPVFLRVVGQASRLSDPMKMSGGTPDLLWLARAT